MITSAADGSKVHIADSAVSVRVWPPSRYNSRDGTRHAILPRERLALTILLAVLFLPTLWPDPLARAIDRATGRLRGVSAAAPDHDGQDLQDLQGGR